jgi:hypothetical protein
MTVYPSYDDVEDIKETAQALLIKHLDGTDFTGVIVTDAEGNNDD